jgi:hypothetical protein
MSPLSGTSPEKTREKSSTHLLWVDLATEIAQQIAEEPATHPGVLSGTLLPCAGPRIHTKFTLDTRRARVHATVRLTATWSTNSALPNGRTNRAGFRAGSFREQPQTKALTGHQDGFCGSVTYECVS